MDDDNELLDPEHWARVRKYVESLPRGRAAFDDDAEEPELPEFDT